MMPTANKTIKVDEAVHDELNRLKDELGVETYNEALRRELAITPGVDLDALTAYFREDLEELAKQVVDDIESVGSFHKEVVEDSGGGSENYILRFQSEENGRTIATIGFSEDGITIEYRDQSGAMEPTGSFHRYKPGTDIVTSGGSSIDEVRDEIRDKVEGAFNRWG